MLHLDRGELDLAEADVVRARMLYVRAGAETAVSNVVPVVAGIAALRGEIVTCLKVLDELDGTVLPGQLGYNLAQSRVVALMQARLLPEARAACEAYIDLCSRTGGGEFVASALLDLAAIALMSGDAVSARRFATNSARSFAARRKPVDAALARAVVLRAALAEGGVGRSAVRSGLDAASVLESAGWRVEALRTRLLVVRLALMAGSTSTAHVQLDLAQALARHGTVADRVGLCHARGLLDIAEGRPARAERVLQSGLQLLDDYRAALGAVELRATVSSIGADLSQLGLRLALDSGRPDNGLAWAERLRANALRQPLVRPATDRKLRALQTELRHAVSQNATARQAQLEAAIRARTRIVEPPATTTTATADVRRIADLLGQRALVEYVELDGALHGLTLAAGQVALTELGEATATTELEWLRFALDRLARGRTTAQRAASRASVQSSEAALDTQLVEPLLPLLGDGPLVIVPTGALHALPWAALHSLRGRPLIVAPSVTVWCELAARPRTRRSKTALVAGPRLRYAAGEIRDLAALRPGATVLHGKAATAEATLAALDGAALAHLACHGRFRADSPLFSSLELADGPLNVYELQGLRRAPEVVVLSACDLALSQLHPGDELLGLAAALLGMGTRTIVASVVPVPDAAARRLMLAFHAQLLDGLAPAAALARAQANARVAGFVCLGAG